MPKPRIEYVEDQVMIKGDIIGRGQTSHGKILRRHKHVICAEFV